MYFLVDPEWQRKLSKIDSRFRFGLIEYDNPAQETRLISLVQRIKGRLALPLVDRFAKAWTDFLEDPTLMQIDEKAGKQVNVSNSLQITSRLIILIIINSQFFWFVGCFVTLFREPPTTAPTEKQIRLIKPDFGKTRTNLILA